MSLIKTYIVDAIQNQIGFTGPQSTEAVETLIEILKTTLASGEDILISGFGKYCVKEKRERKGKFLGYPLVEIEDVNFLKEKVVDKLFSKS